MEKENHEEIQLVEEQEQTDKEMGNSFHEEEVFDDGESAANLQEQESQTNCIEVYYNLTSDEVRQGLKRFYKEHSYKKNIIYTLCCVFIIVVNLYDMIFRQNTAAYTYLFVGVALAIIFLLWYSPKRHREKVAMAIEEEKMEFQMQIYSDHILVKEQQGGLRIRFENPHLKIFENEQIFTICPNKERIYILPKRCLEEEDKVRDVFRTLDDRFVQE